MHIICTAGHVDHGKSTLIKSLTGRNPDRLKEERERGLTIDLGFAWTKLPSGREVAFVDVPGHIRFIKNMLAGVGAVDACIFVVDAKEGWMPQSQEHLRILEHLRMKHALLVLTKTSLVDAEGLEEVKKGIKGHIAGSFLEEAPVVATDALSGEGMEELRNALDGILGDTPNSPDTGRPRLWVDRSFSIKGSGTVVTGSLTGGSLAVGEELHVSPSGVQARIRAIQSMEKDRESVLPGYRVALNLSGVSGDEISRGTVLVRKEQWFFTDKIDCELTVSGNSEKSAAASPKSISKKGSFMAYFGSGEFQTRLRVLGSPETSSENPSPEISAGQMGLVRLYLPHKIPLKRGDLFILRDVGRQELSGGGRVLDLNPVLGENHAAPDNSTDRVINERGWITAEELQLLTDESRKPVLGRWIASDDALAAARQKVMEEIKASGEKGLDIAGLDEKHRLVLDTLEDIRHEGSRAWLKSAKSGFESHPFVSELEKNLFSPPEPQGLIEREVLSELVRQGLLVEIKTKQKNLVFSKKAIDAAQKTASSILAETPEGFTVSVFRERLGTSRKYAMAILSHFDETGVTRRREELRIAGPRL